MTNSPSLPRSILHAITGDRIYFLASPMLGEGDTLVFRGTLPPFAAGAPLHTHDAMTETFLVELGALEIDLGSGSSRRLEAGDDIVLIPGTPHGFRNPLDRETSFVTTASPGIELERFLRSIYAVASDGGADAAGMPRSPLALAAMMSRMDMVMMGIPRTLQKWLVEALARVARLTGTAGRIDRLTFEDLGAA